MKCKDGGDCGIGWYCKECHALGASDSSALLAAQGKLIALAAEMVLGKGLPSSFVEDHQLPKTTPVTARRLISQELERMDRTTKDWAYRLRQISNSLTTNTQVNRPQKVARRDSYPTLGRR